MLVGKIFSFHEIKLLQFFAASSPSNVKECLLSMKAEVHASLTYHFSRVSMPMIHSPFVPSDIKYETPSRVYRFIHRIPTSHPTLTCEPTYIKQYTESKASGYIVSFKLWLIITDQILAYRSSFLKHGTYFLPSTCVQKKPWHATFTKIDVTLNKIETIHWIIISQGVISELARRYSVKRSNDQVLDVPLPAWDLQ